MNLSQKIIFIFLSLKTTTFLFIALAYQSVPFCEICRAANFVYPPDSPINLATAYQTWDAQHYLYLADIGYMPNQGSNAFYPLLPWLIRAGRGIFFGNTFLSGFIIANLISLGAVIMLYRLTVLYFYPRLAFITCLFVFAFPASFYLHLIYTEGLFLLLTTTAFYTTHKIGLSERRNEKRVSPPNPLKGGGAKLLFWKSTGIFIILILTGFLLPFTRANGIFVVLPIVYALFFEASTHNPYRVKSVTSLALA